MATTRALAAGAEADGFQGLELIEDSELTVTSARADNLKAFLPAIDDGAGITVDDGYTCTISANSTGSVEIVDIFGARVVLVLPGTTRQVAAFGDVDDPSWIVSAVKMLLPATAALATNGTLLPALGGELSATLANDPADVAAGAELLTSITVTGAALGDPVIAGFDKDLAGLTISAFVSATNTVKVKLDNLTGSGINLATGNFFVKVFPRVGNLPASATLGVSAWMRVSLPDGTVGLVPVFAE